MEITSLEQAKAQIKELAVFAEKNGHSVFAMIVEKGPAGIHSHLIGNESDLIDGFCNLMDKEVEFLQLVYNSVTTWHQDKIMKN